MRWRRSWRRWCCSVAGILVAAWTLIAPRPAAIRTLQVLMVIFVASGIIGVVLHYKGNEAFELEMSPSRAGLSLISKTLTGATPVLAPGSMSLLGFVGLAFTHRHPALRSTRQFQLEGGTVMTRVLAAVALIVALAVAAQTAYAQVGKSVTIVDANTIAEADLAKLRP